MAAAAGTRSVQAATLVLVEGVSPAARASQAAAFALGAFPAENVRSSSSQVLALVERTPEVRSSQASLLVAARGRTRDPRVFAWTFTLDGHDYYVLRLGDQETLVYDTHSDQWYVWGSDITPLWAAYTGSNWVGAERLSSQYGSNVLVGDDASGALYFLNPTQEFDDDRVDEEIQRNFLRKAMGQVPVKGYDYQSCYGVQLLGSVGDVENTSLTAVTLKYSDDRGKSFENAGTVTVTPEDYDARVYWRSLGSFRSPGRLFLIEDEGALTRIDSLDMESDIQEG